MQHMYKPCGEYNPNPQNKEKLYNVSGLYVISLTEDRSHKCVGPTRYERDDIYTWNLEYHLQNKKKKKKKKRL